MSEEAKRKPVKVRLIDRVNEDGEVAEVYCIMEELIGRYHREVEMARFVLMWKEGWTADTDGILTYARIKKATDVDKALAKDGTDFVIQLNFEAWKGLAEAKQRQIIDHELYHAAQDQDEDGEQKMDDMDRLCWRLRKHSIQEFPEIIHRYGIEAVLHLNDAVRDAVEHANRPLLRGDDDDEDAAFTKKVEGVLVEAIQGTDKEIICADGRVLRGTDAPPADTSWRLNGVCAAGFSNVEDDLLDKAEIPQLSLGKLHDLIDGRGDQEDLAKWHGLGTAVCNRIAKKLRRYLEEIHALPAV